MTSNSFCFSSLSAAVRFSWSGLDGIAAADDLKLHGAVADGRRQHFTVAGIEQ